MQAIYLVVRIQTINDTDSGYDVDFRHYCYCKCKSLYILHRQQMFTFSIITQNFHSKYWKSWDPNKLTNITTIRENV